MQVTTIGLDLAKHWFQVWTRTVRSSFVASCGADAVPGRHGGLCDGVPLGT